MFGKNQPVKGPPTSSEIETMIGLDTVVHGTLASKGSIRVDGKLEGGVSEASSVIVGEHGEIQGDVTAGYAVIGGKIVGNIFASAAIEILHSAEIHGDIKTAALTIAEGATFEGNCTMTKEKQVIEMDVSAKRR